MISKNHNFLFNLQNFKPITKVQLFAEKNELRRLNYNLHGKANPEAIFESINRLINFLSEGLFLGRSSNIGV